MFRTLSRRTAVLPLVAVALLALPAPAFAAGSTVPSAPRAPYAYPGVDGVRLYWSSPLNTGGGLNVYRVYRTDGASPPDVLVAEIPATSTRTWLDSTVTGGATLTYAITAANDAGESVQSPSKTVAIPSPVEAGTVDALAVDGGADSWTNGGSWAFATPAEVQVTWYDAARFVLTGTSTDDSAQGAKTIGLNIGSMVDGNRPVPGQTYATHYSMYGAATPAGALTFTPNLNPCGSSTGSIAVDEASFEADGRPLVFSARFVYQCGGPVYGTIRWHAHDGIEAVAQSRGPLDFGQAPRLATTGPLPLVLRNAGQSPQQLGQATITGTHAVEFALDSDACSGTLLAPGGTCAMGVTTTPAETGSRTARLQLTDQTVHGMRDIPLAVDAITAPGAPSLSATSAYGAVRLSWQHPGGSSPITGYRVYRGASADSLELLAELPGTQATMVGHEDRTATPGATYHYAVSAANLAGEGARSAIVSGAAATTAVAYATEEYLGNGNYTIAVQTDAGIRQRVTTADADHDLPAVSPDGTQLVYASDAGNPDGNYSLWVQPIAGGSPRRLTSGSAYDDVYPSWSPDGSRIAFTRIAMTGARSVQVVPAAGGTPTAVPGTSGDLGPTWSPNGRLLAVTHVTELTGDDLRAELAVTSLDGRYRRLVAGASGSSSLSWDPSWSPDGTRIAFVRQTSTASAVATVPAAGGPATVLTAGGFEAVSADWSPDGTRIVYEKFGFPANSLWSIAPTGGTPAPISGNGYDQISPAAIGPRLDYVPAAPAAVTGLATTLGSGKVTLSWAAPAGAAYYVVRRSGPGGAAPASPEAGLHVYAGTGRVATAASLANGTAYAFSVFAMSARGDASPARSRQAAPAATPAVTPAGSVLNALHGNGPSFTARWGGPLPAGQVYDVQRAVRTFTSTTRTWSAPVWSTWQSGTTAMSAVVPATAGTTYHLRARVRDAFGNATPWSPVAVDPVPYDDRALAASGSWSAVAAAGRFAGTLRVSGTAGASLSYSAYGSALGVVADRCPSCGQVKVYLDGVYKGTVDTRASGMLARQVVWSARFAGIGRHTLTLVVVGTGGRPAVRIDGLTATR